ncbi:hypothetical protein EYZ11_004760 [Aspergillus tanneri]|uniref:Uncharacterized protein n=1 Tax=Aspergillus tanneri TaxID=1220188 RepID=A0A4S3JJX1_9EURO|nr:hypothetical protein EYZ11_004760 [Aspergillus tanneri]
MNYFEGCLVRKTLSFVDSAVNLRGEYHTDNVTTFDENIEADSKENRDRDVEMSNGQDAPEMVEDIKEHDTHASNADSQTHTRKSSKTPKLLVSKCDDEHKETKVDLHALYPMFWGLQAYFSAPTKAFDPQHFSIFKSGLEATLSAFRSVNTEIENSGTSRMSEETRKPTRRKRTADGQEIASSFNPKYLTSRDLFGLEVNDTAFRRHVLVQALILLDFMLSLTPTAKAKLIDLTNKSVLYGFVLSEEDTTWAMKMRKAIEEYLQEGIGGKFYYRMVDTVLSRDKNWVRWKAEGCPLIEKLAVSVTEYLGAREHATKVYANKRLRPSPMGSLDLKFLSEGVSTTGVGKLKEPERFTIPTPDSFMMGIMDDELEIDTAQSKDDKEHAIRAKASKTWRILRLAARSKLAVFDKIEDGKNLKVLFENCQPNEGTPQALESDVTAKAKASTESQDNELIQDAGVSTAAEKESSSVAAEQSTSDLKDAITAEGQDT